MPGADPAGYAGFRDKVNRHVGRRIGAALLLSVFNFAYEATRRETQGPVGFQPESAVTAAVGQSIAELGKQMVERSRLPESRRLRQAGRVRALRAKGVVRSRSSGLAAFGDHELREAHDEHEQDHGHDRLRDACRRSRDLLATEICDDLRDAGYAPKKPDDGKHDPAVRRGDAKSVLQPQCAEARERDPEEGRDQCGHADRARSNIAPKTEHDECHGNSHHHFSHGSGVAPPLANKRSESRGTDLLSLSSRVRLIWTAELWLHQPEAPLLRAGPDHGATGSIGGGARVSALLTHVYTEPAPGDNRQTHFSCSPARWLRPARSNEAVFQHSDSPRGAAENQGSRASPKARP